MLAFPLKAFELNDSGVQWCADSSNNQLSCPQNGFEGQDGEFGRDAQALVGSLEKEGAGFAGFDFTKLDVSGTPLPENASNWQCVRDNYTGLVWEVKASAPGLRATSNTYSWYSNVVGGGGLGVEDGGDCSGSACDTASYVNAIENLALCGQSGWRVPSRVELRSIANHALSGLSIDTSFFPNARLDPLWTADLVPGAISRVRDFYFDRALSFRAEPNNPRRLRLVSGDPPVPSQPVGGVTEAFCDDSIVASTPDAAFSSGAQESVVHEDTGLEWKRCELGKSWTGTTCSGTAEVIPWSAALAAGASSEGWRLPSLPELESLIERCRLDPAINTNQFPEAGSGWLWSSTPFSADGEIARIVNFSSGIDGADLKTRSYAVRLVRDAITGPPQAGNVTVRISVAGNGRVGVQSEDVTCSDRCDLTVPAGTNLVLVAEPDEGFRLTGWSGHCESHPLGCLLNADQSRAVSADFQPLGGFGGLTRVDGVMSGMWHHPTRSGEGFQIEVLDEGRALVTWFTYDNSGNQAWFTAVGEIYGNSIFVEEFLETEGGVFGPDFNPDDVVRRVAGELRIRFDSCNAGAAIYNLPDYGAEGSVPIARTVRMPGAICKSEGGSPALAEAGYTGSWRAPDGSGQGFMFQSLTEDRLLAIWYSYRDDGSQAWFVGVGDQTGPVGRFDFPLMQITRGARFGDQFDPDDVVRETWGTMEVDFSSCDQATLEYSGQFGSGTMDLIRLTRLHEAPCNPPEYVQGLRVVGPSDVNRVLAVDSAAQTVDLDVSLVSELNIQPSSRFVIASTESLPQGLAGRVIELNQLGSAIRVEYDRLALHEVYESAGFAMNRRLRPSDLDGSNPSNRVVLGSPNSKLKRNEVKQACGSQLQKSMHEAETRGFAEEDLFIIPMKAEVWDGSYPFNLPLVAGGVLDGCLVTTIDLVADLTTGGSQSIESASFSFETDVYGDVTVSFPVGIDWFNDWSLLPAPLKFSRVPLDHFAITGLTPSLDFKAGVEADLGADYAFTLAATASMQAGAVYSQSDGFDTFRAFTPTFDASSPGFSASASLGGSIGPKLIAEFDAFGIALAEGSVDARITARAEASFIPQQFWAIFAGIRSAIGLDIVFLDPFELVYWPERRIRSSEDQNVSHVFDLEIVGDGVVLDAFGEVLCDTSCSISFPEGESLTLISESGPRSEFIRWSGVSGCASSTVCTFTILESMQVSAQFQSVFATPTLAVQIQGGAGSGVVSIIEQGANGSAILCEPACTVFDTNRTYLLQAEALNDFEFGGWSGACSGGAASCQVTTSINGTQLVAAQFEPTPGSGPGGPAPGETFSDCSECPTMIGIPAGTFLQGSPPNEPERDSNEGPQRVVSISTFAMSIAEITYEEWDACFAAGACGRNAPDWGMGRGDRPVGGISWSDAQEYVSWLSIETGGGYRLPTESEWEYAARAGTSGRFNTGSCISTSQANFDGSMPADGCSVGNFRQDILPVASFSPNAFGLYDTHGNVLEWVQDCWNNSYSGAPTDGSAWISGACDSAVIRGGSAFTEGSWLRSADRHAFPKDTWGQSLGFRVVREYLP